MSLVEQFFKEAVEHFTRLDFAVNVAGGAHVAKPMHELSAEDIDEMYAINQRAVSVISFLDIATVNVSLV